MDSITTTERAFVAREVARIEARRILEIGAFEGATTEALCAASAPHGGHVVVIDPMCWAVELCVNVLGVPIPRALAELVPGPIGYERAFWRTLRAAKRDGDVTLFRALSTDPHLIARRHPLLAQFDLAVIDGDRGYDAVWSDLVHWGVRVRPGGAILLRGVCAASPGVVKAFRRLGRERGARGVRTSTPADAGSFGKIEILTSLA